MFKVRPTTEELLVSGGDARIALDPLSGQNKYGCQPHPDPDLLDFASSTASVITQAGYAAADNLRERLLNETDSFELAQQHIRMELLSDVADLGVRLAFATSGTDAHFMAARYAARSAPLTVVMVEEAETGSGVRAALLSSSNQPVINAVSLRGVDGMPRLSEDIDADVSALVRAAVALGRHVLLIMVDQSKTGIIAPSVSCVMQLHQLHPDHVAVLVDACQFRIAKPALRAYLNQGFMVAVTGSKFFAGPSFSAALLLPVQFEQQREERNDLSLLLRWEAALVEYRRFRELPQSRVMEVMENFGQAVQQRLASDPRFEPLAVLPLSRRPLIEAQSWDHLPSIFPFLLHHVILSPISPPEGESELASLREFQKHVGRRPLTREETLRVYRQLAVSEQDGIGARRCHLGQPVACGVRNGVAVSALRLCLSARLISDAMLPGGMDRLADDALVALDKTAWLVDRLSDNSL